MTIKNKINKSKNSVNKPIIQKPKIDFNIDTFQYSLPKNIWKKMSPDERKLHMNRQRIVKEFRANEQKKALEALKKASLKSDKSKQKIIIKRLRDKLTVKLKTNLLSALKSRVNMVSDLRNKMVLNFTLPDEIAAKLPVLQSSECNREQEAGKKLMIEYLFRKGQIFELIKSLKDIKNIVNAKVKSVLIKMKEAENKKKLAAIKELKKTKQTMPRLVKPIKRRDPLSFTTEEWTAMTPTKRAAVIYQQKQRAKAQAIKSLFKNLKSRPFARSLSRVDRSRYKNAIRAIAQHTISYKTKIVAPFNKDTIEKINAIYLKTHVNKL